MNCRDCGQPMILDMQEQRNAPDLAIVTCKNKACTLYSVTLSTDVYAALTEAQAQEYRNMVANLKRTLGMGSK